MLALAALVALAAPVDNPSALRDVAKKAAADERWCDAHGHFRRLFARTGELKHLYNAAEVARAAGDNVSALAAYRDVKSLAEPTFPERARVDANIAELEAALATGALGARCADPAPACGDGFVEGVEQCDDVNADDGDGCTAMCTVASPPTPASAATTTPVPVEPLEPVEAASAPLAPLAVTGVVVAAAGGVAAVGLGAWALALDAQLRTPAPEVTRAEKDAALALGWPVVLGAGAGVVVAAVGTALAFTGGDP